MRGLIQRKRLPEPDDPSSQPDFAMRPPVRVGCLLTLDERGGSDGGRCPAGAGGIQMSRKAPEWAPRMAGSGQFDLDVHTGSQIELHQRVDGLRSRLHDIKHALVRTNLELLTALLIDVGPTVDRELLDTRRQRNGTANKSTRTTSGVGDVAGRLVEHAMIECLQTNTDILRFHVH